MSLVCYLGEKRYKIDQERATEILNVMLNPENRKIISCIKNEPKNVIQIHEETSLAISTVYRRLRQLEKKKLLILSGNISKDRKTVSYKSKIRKVVAMFEDGVVDLKIYSNLKT